MERQNYITANIMAAIYNTQFKTKRKKPYTAEDFLRSEPEGKQGMVETIEALNAMFGGIDKR